MIKAKGKFVIKNNKFIYKGGWLDDKPHVKGIKYYENGSKY